MFKHPPFLVDAHKWCDNKVETRDVHVALKPLHGSQRRTQIVVSVSKVAWMRVKCPLTKLTTMCGVLHTKSLSIHSKQTGASAVEESQWIMCTLSADL